MRNLSLALNAVLLVAVIVLYVLHFSNKSAAPSVIVPPANMEGIKIAYVNIDTLNERYEWLKQQKEALEQRIKNTENALRNKQESLMRDMAAFEEKAQGGAIARADLEKEYNTLLQRREKLGEEEARLGKLLADDQQKANSEMWSNLENKLKTLQSQIGYDYILAYSKGGGQVLLANDSLEITQQVLQLLNAKEGQ